MLRSSLIFPPSLGRPKRLQPISRSNEDLQMLTAKCVRQSSSVARRMHTEQTILSPLVKIENTVCALQIVAYANSWNLQRFKWKLSFKNKDKLSFKNISVNLEPSQNSCCALVLLNLTKSGSMRGVKVITTLTVKTTGIATCTNGKHDQWADATDHLLSPSTHPSVLAAAVAYMHLHVLPIKTLSSIGISVLTLPANPPFQQTLQ